MVFIATENTNVDNIEINNNKKNAHLLSMRESYSTIQPIEIEVDILFQIWIKSFSRCMSFIQKENELKKSYQFLCVSEQKSSVPSNICIAPSATV